MPRVATAPRASFVSLAAACLLTFGAGCGRGSAMAARPELAGTWDLIHDDVMEVELRTDDQRQTLRLPADGGHTSSTDAGPLATLDVDCARPELVCPAELWPAELHLDNRTGDVSDDGERFALSFAGEGTGVCRFLPGSVATADIASHGSPSSGAYQATVLSEGVLELVLPGACFDAELAHAEVVLRLGFTAARR